jgi:hypothetical protein
MAYQLQTLPQFTPQNPTQDFMKSYGAAQESHSKKLEQQRLKKDIAAYDQRLNAELAQMLAATEASQASTQHSLAQTAEVAPNAEMQRRMHAEQMALAELQRMLAPGESQAKIGQYNASAAASKAQTEGLELDNALKGFNLNLQIQDFAQSQEEAEPIDSAALVEEVNRQYNPTITTILDTLPENMRSDLLSSMVPMDSQQENQYFREKKRREANLPEAQKAYEEESAKLSAKDKKVKLQEITKSNKTIDNLNTNLTSAQSAYNQVPWYEKGVFAGNREALSSAGQELDNKVYSMLLDSIEKLEGTGTVSEGDIAILKGIQPNRRMNPEAFSSVVQFIKTVGDRERQYNTWMSSLLSAQNPMMTQEKAQAGWDEFALSNPVVIPDVVKSSAYTPEQSEAQKEAQRRGLPLTIDIVKQVPNE